MYPSTLAQRRAMAQRTVPPQHEQRLRQRVSERKCITVLPNGCTCDRETAVRGLCVTCKQQFYNMLDKLPNEEARQLAEDQAIAEGRILPSGVQRSWASTNPFADLGAS